MGLFDRLRGRGPGRRAAAGAGPSTAARTAAT